MTILITGADGFLGRNLRAHLEHSETHKVLFHDVHDSASDFEAALKAADVIFHCAGVNRPESPNEFDRGNRGFTREICDRLRALKRTPLIVMSSSTQAALDNPYGISKRGAEDALMDFAHDTGARVCNLRLTNVFGKWCRPNYNSVVATFCYNIARDLPIEMSSAGREIHLVYIDDVVAAFTQVLADPTAQFRTEDLPTYTLTLGDLVGRLQAFHEMGSTLVAPDFSLRFNQQLYATYLSYVPAPMRSRDLRLNTDPRGTLAEFIKSRHFGQIFVSRTKSGVTRGNHYHHTKTEKFFVVEGEGLIRMRPIESSEVVEYRVCGRDFQVIDIPPGYTHSIENVGAGEMVTLFWSSEIFNPDRPDTYFLPVLAPTETLSSVTG